ncbi:MAG: YdcF family protein [Cyanobacteria bacterium]|nr:YdcF family protein [Cyanobacteriota bacterium]MEB3268679.1 YdcF family protein [Leptolyngbya sp.]
MRSRRPRQRFNVWPLLLLVPTLWVGQGQVKAHLRQPEAILVLGGSPEREHFAAEFAQDHPDLEIWVSSGTNPEYAEWLFHEAAISRDRVHLDYQAVDTVTNFTTLVDDLEAAGIHSVYLITSDYHMRRAMIIGQIVLGSRDISFKPVVVPSAHPEPETLLRGVRDGARAILWVFTGRTGSSLRESISHRP